MGKAQTDVVAALRIELDATKAALAKSEGARSALAAELERMVTGGWVSPEAHAKVVERVAELEAFIEEPPPTREEMDVVMKRYEEIQAIRDAEDAEEEKHIARLVAQRDEARADVAAHSAPCSECKCQMRVCMDCAESALAALRVERDAARADRDNFEARLEAVMSAVRVALPNAGLHSCTEGDHVAAIVAERDALTKQVEALTSKLEAERDLAVQLVKNEAARTRTVEAERDSLRERLGDAERVIEAAREYRDLQHSWSGFDAALAEFDAKWGKR